MSEITKGRSPFYPGQPIPVELFTGRRDLVGKIMTRGVAQVANSKPVTMFVQGDYGIGKSSLSTYVQSKAEREHNLFPIYATLGGATSLKDVTMAIMEGLVRSGATDPTRFEKLKGWTSKYLGGHEVFGVKVNLDMLKTEALSATSPFGLLSVLEEVFAKLRNGGAKGLFLVLDEINGITKHPEFSHFIKGIVDNNATGTQPLPLLLMLCGVEDRRNEMIRHHVSVGRVFDVIDIAPMDPSEMSVFFKEAFDNARMTVADDAMFTLTHYSAGLPKIMHEIGDATYYIDNDGIVDSKDAFKAVLSASDAIGRKYVEPEVYSAISSKTYHSILLKLGQLNKQVFSKSELAAGLSTSESRNLTNFLTRLKTLNVLKNTENKGEYEFIIRMVQVYVWLKSTAGSSSLPGNETPAKA